MAKKKEVEVQEVVPVESPILENSEADKTKNNKAPRPDKKYREEGDLLIPIENE